MSKPAQKSATLLELEALLTKHAIEPAGGLPVVRTDVWQAASGEWIGHFAVQRTIKPVTWCTCTQQGIAKSSAETERLLLETAKLMLGWRAS